MSYLEDIDPNNLLNIVNDLDRRLKTVEQATLDVGTLEEISNDAGELEQAQVRRLTAGGRLNSTLLAADNMFFVGGSLGVMPKSGQIAAAIDDAQTTVDFGQAMTASDWVKFQGPDADGEMNLEWMLIGTLVEGTTYNVTRDVDGSGANRWADATPYGIIGQEGDCRVELIAGDEAQVALIRQGSAWDSYFIETSMSTLDGAITAANGAIKISSAGIEINGILYPLIFTAEDSVTREARIGMYEEGGSTVPGFQILYNSPVGSELVLNPGFETGSITNWALTGTYEKATNLVHSGSYSLELGSAPSTGKSTGTSDKFATTAGINHLISIWDYASQAGGIYKAEIKWYDATPTLIQTDTIYSTSSAAVHNWTQRIVTVKSPAGSTQAEIVLTKTLSTGYVWFDDVSVSVPAVANSVSLTDDGVILKDKAYIKDTDGRILPPNDRRIMRPSISDFLDGINQDPFYRLLVLGTGTINNQTGEASHPGLVRVASVAAANTGGRIIGAHSTSLLLQGGEVFESIFRLLTNHSTIGARMGFQDIFTQVVPTDGAYINISQVTLTGMTYAGGATSTTGSSYTIAINTWYRCKVVVNSASLVTFYLYSEAGVLLWSDTLTTNIPTTAGQELGYGVTAFRTTATASDLYDFDWEAFYNTDELAR